MPGRMQGLHTMSSRELNRVEVIVRVRDGGLSQERAAALLGLTSRQIRRLLKRYESGGGAALVSAHRGRPSNRTTPAEIRRRALAIVRERYSDFGPTLAREKLAEAHGLKVGVETLRTWMTDDGIWTPRAARQARPHQPRYRRPCVGELIQIDGCEHDWFEGRAPKCTLLVFVDDATSRIQELLFVEEESAFDYFLALRSYLMRYGKPVAFYSDKHSIFRSNRGEESATTEGITQFTRALGELNIDIICANSSQAKGRVERAHLTLQDRLVKELRLRGISSMKDGNAYLPSFRADYNRRFGKPPRSEHDAHRPLRRIDDLDRVLTWQEDRKLSTNLVVHYKCGKYLVEPTPGALKLRGRNVRVFEHEDGRVDIRHGALVLEFTKFEQRVDPAQVVDNKRLGAALAVALEFQKARDAKQLNAAHLSKRRKNRIRQLQAS